MSLNQDGISCTLQLRKNVRILQDTLNSERFWLTGDIMDGGQEFLCSISKGGGRVIETKTAEEFIAKATKEGIMNSGVNSVTFNRCYWFVS